MNRLLAPLQSRKVKVAIATVIAAYLAQWLPGVNEEVVFTVLSVGVSIILGIAIEDNGWKKTLGQVAGEIVAAPPANPDPAKPAAPKTAEDLLAALKALRGGR